ncbi:PepSY-associated TM helix domain-containing protein [Mucilaginibacter gynuensis]|uniref:PepSY-associated TM helix domain-containing protein n=1 Tax=Mucilaginibacter gynuensis TaxID=1302236 RepID=A0ABP8FTH2_9SPHI
MKAFKKITGWLHLWLGLISGIILIVVALTGALLTFEEELDPIFFKKSRVVEVSGTRLPVDSLVQIANTAFPGKKAARLIIPETADRSVTARIGARGKGLKIAYINPYTGAILYKGPYEKEFFQQVRNLHRYLLMEETGKVITGISCSICLFLVISGIIIWWPANKKAIKQRFKIKWDASGKRLTWDLHSVSGFYISLFLLLITLTGFVWSYQWAEDLIYTLADGKQTKEAKVKNLEKLKVAKPGIYQGMLDQTNQIYTYTGTVAFNLPAKPALAVTVQKELEESVNRQVDAASFDSHTGKFISKLPYAKLSNGTKIRRMILPIHTGSLLGWLTKLLYLIVCLFTASLPVTGLLIWLNRKKKSKTKSPRRRSTVAKPKLVPAK